MTSRSLTIWTVAGVIAAMAAIGLAQFGGGFGGRGFRSGGGRGFGGGGFGRGPRIQDLSVDRNGVQKWYVDPHFNKDVFTFVRIIYDSVPYDSTHSGGSWWTDYPDSDLNFSFRLQQLTAIKVNPVPIQMRLTDPRLFDYPFIYMLEVGRLRFRDEEIPILRKYLLNGGFLMVDDHWGVQEYTNFYEQIKRVFPDREPQDLPLSHPIFHCVFDLHEFPQEPGIDVAMRHQNDGVRWERADAVGAHYRGIFDDKGRMMVIICSNTDLGDGWEREGDSRWYFETYSEKVGYPMGVNIVFYAMSH